MHFMRLLRRSRVECSRRRSTLRERGPLQLHWEQDSGDHRLAKAMTDRALGFAGLPITLVLCLAAALTYGLAGPSNEAAAVESEEFVLRVAARLHENGTHLEFAVRRIDAAGRPRAFHLADNRFLRLDLSDHRWRRASEVHLFQAPYYDDQSSGAAARPAGARQAIVRILARSHPTRGLFEFGVEYRLDPSQWTDGETVEFSPPIFVTRRFFPNRVTHHRWLYGGEMRFTRVWIEDDGLMDFGGEMENIHSSEIDPPPPTFTECLNVWEGNPLAMPPEGCLPMLATYCADNPNHAVCRRLAEDE